MVKRIIENRFTFYLFLIDFLLAIGAWLLLPYFLLLTDWPVRFISKSEIYFEALVLGVLWVVFYSFWGFYYEVLTKSRIKEVVNLYLVSMFGAVLVSFFFVPMDLGGNEVNYKLFFKIIMLYYVIHSTMLSIGKLYVLSRIKRKIVSKEIKFNTLIIGASQNALEIHNNLESIKESIGWDFIGYLHVSEQDDSLKDKLNYLGSFENVAEIIEKNNVVQVVIAIEPSEHKKIQDILELLEAYEIKISIIPDLYNMMVASVSISHVFSIPLIEIKRDILPPWQKNLKRMFDIVMSLFVLTFGFPFLLTIGLITKFSSKGPMIYYQERVGFNGKPFNIFKFRSMVQNAEVSGPALSSKRDSRITPWGLFMRKTRLDELPQFYNVLIGDMSLVGPRPEREFYMKQIIEISPQFKYRLRVKPGITSLAQVKFGYAETVEEMTRRVKYDIFYIKNMSLVLDIRILFFTIYIVFKGRGQ